MVTQVKGSMVLKWWLFVTEFLISSSSDELYLMTSLVISATVGVSTQDKVTVTSTIVNNANGDICVDYGGKITM